MLSGFYTAASGMLQQQRKLNVLSNNMINSRTPGFRAERVTSSTFEQELSRQEQGNKTKIGAGAPIAILQDVQTVFDPSYLENTDRPYDIAINGDGFFNIDGGDKQFLTRNGNFDIDSEGYLVLKNVGRVLGQSGAIQVGSSNFKVDKNGIVYDAEGEELDTLLITQPQDLTKLEKYSNGMYVDSASQASQVENAKVEQNAIERSNVDLNRELTLVMEAQRSFQACSTILKGLDEINQKTANQIAGL